MRILVIIHVESEGPGTLGTFFESQGAQLQTVRLYAGEDLPREPGGLAAVVSMGGPMNVYDEGAYPFLRSETDFLEKALDADIPIIGVCLGSQMVAKAASASVNLGAVKEVGWGTVTLTGQANSNPFFRGLPPTFDVFQWHEDVFDVPVGGTLLASSEICAHQAFAYRNALGLQFHVEVTADILESWFADSRDQDVTEVLRRYDEVQPEMDRNAHQIYRNFMDRIAK